MEIVSLILLCLTFLMSFWAVVSVSQLRKTQERSDTGMLAQTCDTVESAQKRLEEMVRSEIAQNRRESGENMVSFQKALSESLKNAFHSQRETQILEARATREEVTFGLKAMREDVILSLKTTGDLLLDRQKSAFEGQQKILELMDEKLTGQGNSSDRLRENVIKALETLKIGLIEKVAHSAQENRVQSVELAKSAREDAATIIKAQGEILLTQRKGATVAQNEKLASLEVMFSQFVRTQKAESQALRDELAQSLVQVNELLRVQTGVIAKGQQEQTKNVGETLESFAVKVGQFGQQSESRLEKLREGVEKKLGDLQIGNEKNWTKCVRR